MDYLVTDTSLSAVADAIRTKGGTSASLAFPSGFVSAINSIETSSGGISVDDIAMRTISGVVSGSAVRVSDYAFQGCSNLTTAIFPQASTVGSYAFQHCSNLTTISFPQAEYIERYAFQYCSNLTTAIFPQASAVGIYAFQYCFNLATAIFNNTYTTEGAIFSYAFRSCYHLTSLYLLASTPYRLAQSGTFISTPISSYTASTGGVYGSIFVRQSLYDAYISSTNWSYYSSRFVGLTDEQVEYVMEHGTHVIP